MRAITACLATMLLLGCAESKPAERPVTVAAPYEPPVEEETREGAVTPEEYAAINDAMGRKMDVLNACYEQEMEKRMDRTFQGRVTVAMKIGRDGRPMTVEILEDTLKSESVNQCLKDTIKTFEFGKLTGEAQFVYPIAFAPQY